MWHTNGMVSIDDNSMIANRSCSGTHCDEPVFATVRASVPVINNIIGSAPARELNHSKENQQVVFTNFVSYLICGHV